MALVACISAVAATGGLWLDVPYIHQEKDGCGSAALAMVLQYWQGKGAALEKDRAEPAFIQRELYDPQLHGISALRMEGYVRDSGLDAFTFRGEWTDLRANIAKGRPLIAALKPRMAPAHYVVIAGVSAEDTTVLLNDPERGKLVRMERGEFEKSWKRAESWTLLALPKQRD